jgi:hypothetical protein
MRTSTRLKITCLAALVATGVGLSLTIPVRGGNPTQIKQADIDAAIADTMNTLLNDPSFQQRGDNITDAVNGLFPMAHPEIAVPQRLQDPEFAKAQAASLAIIMDPQGTEKRLLKDPAFRQRHNEAIQAMQALRP